MPRALRGFLSVTPLEDRLQPTTLNPVYAATFNDAVTGDNAFTAADGLFWTVTPGADNYQTDGYERPTAQTYQVRRARDGGERFAAAEYFQNLDIVQAKAGFDANYLYVSIKLAGLNKLTQDGGASREGLTYRYGFRLATHPDGRGGLLVVSDQPQFKNVPSTAYGPEGTFIYRDANRDVGGTGLGVTKQDRPAEVNGNGYERVVAADGKLSSGKQVLWVRVSPASPTTVELALDYKAVGLTAAQLAALPYLQFEANKGTQDPGNYLWNDEYNKNEAGSPYRATAGDRTKSEFGTQGLGNIYELDTAVGGPIVAPTAGTASVSGQVYVDADSSFTKDAGEAGLAGVTIRLTGVDDFGRAVERTTVTDTAGRYSFTGLRAGTYSVAETQPDEFFDGAEAIGTVGGTAVGFQVDEDRIDGIVLADGQAGIDYDFGEISAFVPT